MTEQKVWRYQPRETREQTLLRIIYTLWLELRKPSDQQHPDQIDHEIRQAGAGWALPSHQGHDLHDDDLLTTTQVADQLGLTESTIRDWPRRYGIATHQGRYRWGDIKTVIRSRNRARMKTPLRLHQDVLGNPAVSCDTGGVGRAMPKTEAP